jgi:hypothetical protein
VGVAETGAGAVGSEVGVEAGSAARQLLKLKNAIVTSIPTKIKFTFISFPHYFFPRRGVKYPRQVALAENLSARLAPTILELEPLREFGAHAHDVATHAPHV